MSEPVGFLDEKLESGETCVVTASLVTEAALDGGLRIVLGLAVPS